jgi:hypothetical protein
MALKRTFTSMYVQMSFVVTEIFKFLPIEFTLIMFTAVSDFQSVKMIYHNPCIGNVVLYVKDDDV